MIYLNLRQKVSVGVRTYLKIARFDHWAKNILVLPGVAFAMVAKPGAHFDLWSFIVGMISVGLIASANYVINEYLDAELDRHHPIKDQRPGALGQLEGRIVFAEYLLLVICGLGLGFNLNVPFGMTGVALLILGLIYNVNPIRTKETVYLDVLSEATNNPIRFIFGWFMFDPTNFPPSSILISYWMAGAYLMALKRYAEYREIDDPALARLYRRSFQFYTEKSLLVYAFFCAINSTLFLGVFLIRQRIEYILTFPLIALLFASYLNLSMLPGSAAQAPETLHRDWLLVSIIGALGAAFVILSFVSIPSLHIFLNVKPR
jgi:decaprenyl-phosphate phosphoribosyltransferase